MIEKLVLGAGHDVGALQREHRRCKGRRKGRTGAAPMISKAQAMALASGDGRIGQGANLLLFGPPAEARAIPPPIGLALVETAGAWGEKGTGPEPSS